MADKYKDEINLIKNLAGVFLIILVIMANMFLDKDINYFVLIPIGILMGVDPSNFISKK